MQLIDRNSALWTYLSNDIKGLVIDGEQVVAGADNFPKELSDYSFLVFTFAKAYEGFLKRLFLDLELIKEDEYYSDEIRIGKILNPRYIDEHGNVFMRLCNVTDCKENELSAKLWQTWKRSRNQVFHYFPHNYKRLTKDEAVSLIHEITTIMEDVMTQCDISIQ